METPSSEDLQGQIDAVCEVMAQLIDTLPNSAAAELAVDITAQMSPIQQLSPPTPREAAQLRVFARLRDIAARRG